jgi:hypothetical protein
MKKIFEKYWLIGGVTIAIYFIFSYFIFFRGDWGDITVMIFNPWLFFLPIIVPQDILSSNFLLTGIIFNFFVGAILGYIYNTIKRRRENAHLS